jgi:L-serine dehydratase
MFLSVFDMFKIGIGPSSSHTMGPMAAAGRFVHRLKANDDLKSMTRVEVRLHGSLAFTGKGHSSDTATILGLMGETAEDIELDAAPEKLRAIESTQRLMLGGAHPIAFDAQSDLIFDYGPALAGHANGMVLKGYGGAGELLLERTYYSIGGGFVLSADELAALSDEAPFAMVPFGFTTAAEMLEMGNESGKSVAEMKAANELAVRSESELRDGLKKIWSTMESCMARGLKQEGVLPGGLNVRRRAPQILASLEEEQQEGRNVRFEHTIMDWISLYALAVNEENAAGGRIVTAPTNGAAGIVPAVLRYYLDFCPGSTDNGIHEFLLTAAAIGGLIKHNASISGAEVGCQGEVGSASAMAAAGLAAVLGGSNTQIEHAAEIAIEHHLGMTCDPVGGLVQVPCIERNAMGAVKAVNAASLALRGDGNHFVPLDTAVETMRQTGLDMLSKYKETSQGGLAVNVTEC